MHGHLTDMEKMLNKLTHRCKHWDKIFEQYNVNNYQYIDECRILHENPIHFIDSRGQVHETPLQFIAEYGTVYDDLDYDSNTVAANPKHKCYASMRPRRKYPYIKRNQTYFSRREMSSNTAAIPPITPNNNESCKAEEISKLQNYRNDSVI
jgi:hypothetical protein